MNQSKLINYGAYSLFILLSVAIGFIIVKMKTSEKFESDSQLEEDKPVAKQFDTLESLKSKLTSAELVQYLTDNYPLMYQQYIKTKQINRTLSFIIICVIFSFVISMVITIYYYRNKSPKGRSKERQMEKYAKQTFQTDTKRREDGTDRENKDDRSRRENRNNRSRKRKSRR